MNRHLFVIFIACLSGSLAGAFATDDLGVAEFSIKQDGPTAAKPELQRYILHLQVKTTLESREEAFMKVAIDQKEENKFETVAAKLVWRGNNRGTWGQLINYDVRFTDWRRTRLNIYVFVQPREKVLDDEVMGDIAFTFDLANLKK